MFALGAHRATAMAASVPKPTCQAGDLLETALQGQVPLVDRASGRALSGYNCNLKEVGGYTDPTDVGHQQTAAWGTLDTYRNCVYYGQSSSTGVTDVVDATDPAHPVLTATISTPAMQNPWESLRVNQKRGLLVADHNTAASLDIYDLTADCRHPRLLRSLAMPTAMGHEGWFQPDGMVYYMSCSCTSGVWPIDLSDPSNPREMVHIADLGSIHGGSVSADGTRGYFCQESPTFGLQSQDQLLIVDTSQIALRRPNPTYRLISTLPWVDNAACQSTYPLSYNGHRYVVQYGEETNPATRHCANNPTRNFAAPRIVDVQDELHPVEISNLLLEVDDVANCPLVQADYSGRSVDFFPPLGAGGALFMYDVHHCSPDRLENPTILACEQFLAGLRIYDIRDPAHPRELAYQNRGTISLTDQTIDDAVSRPVVWTDRGLVLWTSEFSGLHLSRFENGVFPLAGGASCADYFYVQYNPITCPSGISAPAAASAGTSPPLPNTSDGSASRSWRVVAVTAPLLVAAVPGWRRRKRLSWASRPTAVERRQRAVGERMRRTPGR